MFFKIKNKVFLIIILLLVSVFFHSKEKFIIKVGCSDGYPKSYLSNDGKHIIGIVPDIVYALNKKLIDVEFIIEDFIPVKRIKTMLNTGELGAHIATSKSEERLKTAYASDIPVLRVEYRVAVLIDDNVVVNNFDDIRKLGNNGIILSKHGTVATKFLEEQEGLIIDSVSKKNIYNLKKLLNKRGRFVYYHTIGLRAAITELDYQDKIKILPVVLNTKYQYILFSKKIPKNVIDKINKALKELESSGELNEIAEKYRK